MTPSIAYLGLGSMGMSMAARLIEASYPLTVWNRSAGKAAPLTGKGAREAATPEDAVKNADFVFSMVADDRALEDVVSGDHGMLSAMKPGAVHVSMSTILPATAQRLAAAHAERDVGYIAAPVFGRPEAAAAGMLWICLSGKAADKERLLPIIKPLCQQHYDFGEEPQAANVIKLSGNFMIASAIEAMSEAFVFGEKNGIDQGRLADFFGSTIFNCPIYKNYGRIIAEQRFDPPGFRLALGRKDIQLVAETARSSNVPMPFLATLQNRYTARVAKGGAESDWTSIALDVASDAGLVR
ncbi:NAD(P)-dependent oxidoreductase [Propionivibrio soli]|uniref:NAD(P)-dependent oxidoreductase n=1 Tax=Propionivibrio soli TaxID=2976531 RepID=UPI0021E8314D|nr:NAD(P)-dependent oxidoreductase [Propionivibrio soli]